MNILLKNLIIIGMFFMPIELSATIKFNDISSPVKFTEITQKTTMSSKEIVRIVTPILMEHMSRKNYNRLYLAEAFIDFYNKNQLQYTSSIEALVSFDIKKYETEKDNGICFSLTQDLFDRLPCSIQACKIGAILPGRYQQKGWHLFPHTAIIIPFENPEDFSDTGYILLDPNFDISTPIVLKRESQSTYIDMGKKGKWKFHLVKNKIMCYMFSNEKKNQDSSYKIYDVMIYILNEYRNSADSALKTMIATDRGIPIVSRDENGKHIAHMKIDLNKRVVSSSVYERRKPLISFEDFSSGKQEFDREFAELLNMDIDSLNRSIRKIINNVSILETLSEEYFLLLNSEK